MCSVWPSYWVSPGRLPPHHDVDAVVAEDALQQVDVGEPRHVVEHQRLIGEQARDHQRQGGVLGAGDRDRAVAAAGRRRCECDPCPVPRSGKRRRSLCETAAPMQKGQPARRVAVPGLAALLIVRQFRRNRGADRRADRPFGSAPGAVARPLACALRRLRLSRSAAAQAALLAGLLRCLRTLVHGGKIKRPAPRDGSAPARALAAAVGACAAFALVARIAASRPHSLRISQPARRCRSSVVEHSLGKGEVVSSILTGSTMKKCRSYWAFALSPLRSNCSCLG